MNTPDFILMCKNTELINSINEDNIVEFVRYVCINGHVNVLEYYENLGMLNSILELEPNALFYMIAGNNLDMIKYCGDRIDIVKMTKIDILTNCEVLICINDYSDILEYLISKGYDVNTLYSNDFYYCYLMATYDSIKVLKLLLNHNFPIGIFTSDSKFLRILCTKGSIRIFKFLLNGYIDKDIVYNYGCITYAIQSNDFELCIIILNLSYNVEKIKNDNILEYAKQHGSVDLIDFILSRINRYE